MPGMVMSDRKDVRFRNANTLNYDFKNIGEHQLGVLLGQEVLSKGGKTQHIRAENFRASITPEEMFAAMNLGETIEHSTYENTDENWFSLLNPIV